MTRPEEARRISLSEDPKTAAALFWQQGLSPRDLERLLSAASHEDESSRAETVELWDAWSRPTEMTLYVPPSLADRPPGVIVGLHGVGGSGAELDAYLRPFADACGAVLLCPTARQPITKRSNFDLAGLFGSRFQDDRWTTDPGDYPARAMRWAREHLAIDTGRCALIGTSMGGIATWSIALRRWDVLSMAASINGAPSMWEMFGPDRTMRELLPNLMNLPFAAVHGSQDQQIPPVLDRDAVGHLRRLGHRSISFIEVPDAEHKLSTMRLLPGTPQFDEVVRCYRSARRTSWPGQVHHHARESEHGRAHWVAMDGIVVGGTASVEARAVTRSRLDIRTVGCSRLRLFLSDRLVEPGPVLVTVNGEEQTVDFRPSLTDAVTTYSEAGADTGRLAHMVVDVKVPEIHE
ncbi:hypothetical protein AB0M94_35975 [Streptomyces xanthochromogenes]|uniref:hypothetical protein n=1 Tax=Streptomyces xanthochromogenes TaxID=67384 RepID=UPI00344AC4F5